MARRGYPPEFRRRVVDLVEGGRKVAEIAAELGISEQTIYTWRRQARIDAGSEAGITTGEKTDVPPQKPVDRTIVDVSRRGGKLTYPDASLAVRPARDRQIEPKVAARVRSAEPGSATTAGHSEAREQTPQSEQSEPRILLNRPRFTGDSPHHRAWFHRTRANS